MNTTNQTESRHVLSDPCCEAYIVFMVSGDRVTIAHVTHPDLPVSEKVVGLAEGRDAYRAARRAGLVDTRD